MAEAEGGGGSLSSFKGSSSVPWMASGDRPFRSGGGGEKIFLSSRSRKGGSLREFHQTKLNAIRRKIGTQKKLMYLNRYILLYTGTVTVFQPFANARFAGIPSKIKKRWKKSKESVREILEKGAEGDGGARR